MSYRIQLGIGSRDMAKSADKIAKKKTAEKAEAS